MQINKKKSIYQRKYYILNAINRINKVYNIVMNDYHTFIFLGYYNKIHEYEIDNIIPMLNIKYIIKQIYIEILNYNQRRDIKMNNNIRKLSDYLIKWNKVKENINVDIPNCI